MNLITYQPSRDLLGRFKPSKRSVIKFLFVAVALGSLYLNYFMFRQFMVVRCDVGGEKIGFFMTQDQCDSVSNYHAAYTTQNDATILANNPDLRDMFNK